MNSHSISRSKSGARNKEGHDEGEPSIHFVCEVNCDRIRSQHLLWADHGVQGNVGEHINDGDGNGGDENCQREIPRIFRSVMNTQEYLLGF